MKILIINPPHPSVGSRLAKEHLPPLGLLSISGSLIDDGHKVELLDGDYHNYSLQQMVKLTEKQNPDIVLTGHSGSSSAQPIINKLSKLLKKNLPKLKIILGGVYPTYHSDSILNEHSHIDIIVRGEGEKIVNNLINAISTNKDLQTVKGISFRNNEKIIHTTNEELIENLDEYRIAWELMDGYNYTYWGNKKAVVIQFSRGCPYPCTYCGQNQFWKKWRHRDPEKLADEIEMLHRTFNIQVVNFADENPSSFQEPWIKFLKALIEKKLNLSLVASIRSDNIVRDENFIHLYKQAGFERFLLGIEAYNQNTLQKIKKHGTIINDKKAIELLRKHDILSMATYVVGFEDEKPINFFYTYKQLLTYDPDQIQILYITPHKWTDFFYQIKDMKVILDNQEKWDYRHQVLEMKNMTPAMTFLCVKLLEIFIQLRPKALYRNFFHKDKKLRKAMRWYTNIGRRVWFTEIFWFIFKEKRVKNKITLNDFWK